MGGKPPAGLAGWRWAAAYREMTLTPQAGERAWAARGSKVPARPRGHPWAGAAPRGLDGATLGGVCALGRKCSRTGLVSALGPRPRPRPRPAPSRSRPSGYRPAPPPRARPLAPA